MMALSIEASQPGSDALLHPQLVAPEPEHCPGPESLEAGRASQCEGCPNQTICSTAPKGPDPDVALITQRLVNVKRKILVGLFSLFLFCSFLIDPTLSPTMRANTGI